MIKAIIPVAGAGTMLRPHTHTQPKPLIPIAGKPILGHIIENLLDAGVHRFTFIIGYLGEKIEEFVRERYSEKIEAEFVLQNPREGLGHAIWTARDSIREGGGEILIVLGDTIFDVDLTRILQSEYSTLGVQEVDDPRQFGVAVVDEDGFVEQVVEKPRIPKSNLALVGLYKIKETESLLRALEEMMRNEERGETGEYHLTDGFMKMIREGVRIRTVTVDNWYDCGRKDTLLETNRILLERMSGQPEYDYPDTVILPPVKIAPGCVIEHSIIGPYVAVDENAVISNSIVRNSILGAYSRLESIILDGSVIGSDAALTGAAHSVNIGDNTQIDFNS